VGAQSRVLSECLGMGFLLMWVERWHWVTGRLIGGAAHCWVLREQVSHCFLVGVPLVSGLAVINTERLTVRLSGLVVGSAVSIGGGSVRTLRTAQWMRASLWPSY
jgi:hypothetical protein